MINVKIYDLKNDYNKALKSLLEGLHNSQKWYQKYLSDQGFEWIYQKLGELEDERDIAPKYEEQYKNFVEDLKSNIKQMILIDAAKYIILVE